ncbi:RR-type MYB transcription factor 5 [Heracleum sosnowskyi]|uniref:RR-type MYB transcription factor 5 n=1 Tax=Heracleum sosnowskyi TaxID=360622 RepID=A0AAD8IRB2_9APIA|nr:RR-type MYB transcription factor 5 [Heracleum sosnowskyi]
MSGDESGDSSIWSREQDIMFENALATYSEDLSDRWEKIAADVPGKSIEEERRKGIAWTEEEHRLFLLGLEKYGKGDWRSISRNFVVTRTPTQVASHAQKYFIRLNSMNKDRRRSSIHDITNVNNGEMSVPPTPITGQANGSSAAGGSSGKPVKQTPQSPLVASGVIYGGTTIGQPVGGSLVAGTPVNLSQQPHMGYGMRVPSGQVVPGAPVNMGPMAYPMPQTSTHR